MEKFIEKLPIEVISKIISYLDIDSRRALNIYNKLKVPKYISDTIGNKIQIPDVFYNDRYGRLRSFSSYINLNTIYIIRRQICVFGTEEFTNYFVEHYKTKKTDLSMGIPDMYISHQINDDYTKMYVN
jgi:hypothetical protein